jgi:hypothetical protein
MKAAMPATYSTEVVRQLVLKVSPLVSHVLVRLLQQQNCFMTTLRLLVWTSCYLALCPTKFCLRCLVVAMILDWSTVGQSCKRFQSDIHTNVPFVRGKSLWLEFNGEVCLPASGLACDWLFESPTSSYQMLGLFFCHKSKS